MNRSTGVAHSRLLAVVCIGFLVLMVAGLWYWSASQKGEALRRYAPSNTQLFASYVDSKRIDSQVTLKIPATQAEEVYEYLTAKYTGKDNLFSEQFPGVRISGKNKTDISEFTDVYYDTPNLALYKNQNSARHRSRVNTVDAGDRKSGRQLVQLKITPPGQFNLRTELKFEVGETVVENDGKNDRKVRSIRGQRKQYAAAENTHPLVKLISKSKRPEFLAAFQGTGIDPFSLKHIFTIDQTRRRIYIDGDGKNILSFSVDTGSADVWWQTESFASVDIGLVEIAYTEANAQKRKMLWDIRDAMVKDLMNRFPSLTVNSDSKYGILLDGFIADMPLFTFLVRCHIL